MGDVINQSSIWKFVGRVSAITGVVCFGLSSTYDMSFGKLGYGGPLVYLFVCSFMWWLMIWGKRIQVSEKFVIWGKTIQVSEKFKGVVGAILFVLICSISVVYEKYVPEKSDAYTSTSYGSFALMSVSLSRKLELGFETGFSAFFLKLFAAQLLKIKWFLLPIALVFCSLVIILYHYPESRVIRVGDEKRQDSLEMGEVSGQRLLSTSNELDSQEESSQAVGEVSDENISEGGEQEEDSTSSLAAVSPSGSGNSYWIKLVLIEARNLSSTEGRDFFPYIFRPIVVYGRNIKEAKRTVCTINSKLNRTFEFPDDGSSLVLFFLGFRFPTDKYFSVCGVEYQQLHPNQMDDKWISLNGNIMGEIHIRITRKVAQTRFWQEIPTQIKDMMVKFRSLIEDGNSKGLPTALSELEMLGDRLVADIDTLETLQMYLLGEIKKHGQAKVEIKKIMEKIQSLIEAGNIVGLSTALSELEMLGGTLKGHIDQLELLLGETKKHGYEKVKIKNIMEKIRPLIEHGNIEGLSTALSEVEMLGGKLEAYIDQLETKQKLLLGEIKEHDQEKVQIEEMKVKFRSLIKDGNIEGLSTALSELEMGLLGKIKEHGQEKVQVSSEKKFTIQNVGMHSYTEPELISADARARGLRRRPTNVQNKQEEDSTSSSLVPSESEHNII